MDERRLAEAREVVMRRIRIKQEARRRMRAALPLPRYDAVFFDGLDFLAGKLPGWEWHGMMDPRWHDAARRTSGDAAVPPPPLGLPASPPVPRALFPEDDHERDGSHAAVARRDGFR